MKGTMRADGVIEVRVSERNLLALLHKLNMPGSARTIISHRGEQAVLMIAETDQDHYAGEPEEPGEMHPLTETFIKDKQDESWGV